MCGTAGADPEPGAQTLAVDTALSARADSSFFGNGHRVAIQAEIEMHHSAEW